jgi:predicted nuclease of predicted toxin-antitoxin system
MPDSEIWNFAKQENFVIVTKDADFSNRILFADPPPRVIHFRTGNLKLADFFHLCDLNWENIVKLSVDHKLIYVYRDRIDLIR